MTGATNPLEAIRAAELEMARRIDEAREQAVETVAAARREARRIVEDARRRGQEEARRRYDAAIDAARDEAVRIVDDGAARAGELTRAAAQDRERTVEAMVAFVLSPPAEEGGS